MECKEAFKACFLGIGLVVAAIGGATNIDLKQNILSKKEALLKKGYPADSLKRFSTHGLNIRANIRDAVALEHIETRLAEADSAVAKVAARAKDSTQIAKIIPQASPVQITSLLNLRK